MVWFAWLYSVYSGDVGEMTYMFDHFKGRGRDGQGNDHVTFFCHACLHTQEAQRRRLIRSIISSAAAEMGMAMIRSLGSSMVVLLLECKFVQKSC